MDSKLIINIKEENFDSLTFESTSPVIAFFSAKRCSVCRLLSPVLEELAEEYDERLKIFSVDVDVEDSLVHRFRLKGIPTLVLFKDGEAKEKISGFQPKLLLEERIKVVFNM